MGHGGCGGGEAVVVVSREHRGVGGQGRGGVGGAYGREEEKGGEDEDVEGEHGCGRWCRRVIVVVAFLGFGVR